MFADPSVTAFASRAEHSVQQNRRYSFIADKNYISSIYITRLGCSEEGERGGARPPVALSSHAVEIDPTPSFRASPPVLELPPKSKGVLRSAIIQ